MQSRKAVLDVLERLDISYGLTEHPAVYTIEEMQSLGITEMGEICKNLFVRDAKGKNHYLIVMEGEKRADLKSIASLLGTAKLSFASEERLKTHLGLGKGAVTPLGIINDLEHKVVVVLDEDLCGKERLGVHPNDNTATVWLSFAGLKQYISCFGNKLHYIKLQPQ